jgi:hypothetical protein
MAAIIVNYAVKSRSGEILRTGLTNLEARNFAFFEGMSRMADLDAACEASVNGGFSDAAVCASWIAWTDLFVTPENLS